MILGEIDLNLENDHYCDMKNHFLILVYNSFVSFSGYVVFTIVNLIQHFFNRIPLPIKKKKKEKFIFLFKILISACWFT